MTSQFVAAIAATLSLAGPAWAGDTLPRGTRLCDQPVLGRCVTTDRPVRALPSADPGRVYLPGRRDPVFVPDRENEGGGLRPFGR